MALLNNDAEAEPGWLEALERAIRQSEDVGMAASKVLVWEDPTRIDKCGHLIYPDGQNRGRGSGQVDRGQFDRMEEVLWPDGCAAMYRRAMLDRIGGFDEDFPRIGSREVLGYARLILLRQGLRFPVTNVDIGDIDGRPVMRARHDARWAIVQRHVVKHDH